MKIKYSNRSNFREKNKKKQRLKNTEKINVKNILILEIIQDLTKQQKQELINKKIRER